MSLQDDIARYANLIGDADNPVFERIAAGLDRDYYLVKLDSLQPVGILDGHYAIAGVRVASTDRDFGLLKVDRDYRERLGGFDDDRPVYCYEHDPVRGRAGVKFDIEATK